MVELSQKHVMNYHYVLLYYPKCIRGISVKLTETVPFLQYISVAASIRMTHMLTSNEHSRLLQAENVRNNQSIAVQRAAAALRNINSNSNSTPFLMISSYANVAATHTQGLQHHQQLDNGIYRSTNIRNNYHGNMNNNSNNSSNNNGVITQSTNKNNSTNSMNNFCNINTFSQSHGAAINGVVDHHKSRDNNATNNNSYHGFQASIKNNNCCNDDSKQGLRFDENKYISCWCNTDVNSINNSPNNGNANNNTNNFGTKLVQMTHARNENQCDLQNMISTKGFMLVENMNDQIALLKQKVAAIEKQPHSNNSSKNSSQRSNSKTDSITVYLNTTTNGTNVSNSATQVMSTRNNISMNQSNNNNINNNNYKNKSNIGISLMNGLPNDIILSQALSPDNMNLNSNNSNILFSSNQLAYGN